MYAVGLIIIWLRLMRSCRAFRTLGPFIAILGSVAKDTLKFAFLFFEFFIPYTMGFWIIFGDGEFGGGVGYRISIATQPHESFTIFPNAK